MSIVKMKKLQLIVATGQKEALLKDLMLLGCAELHEPEAALRDEALASVLKPIPNNAAELKNRCAVLEGALKALDHYAPEKTGLLSAKPEASLEAVLNENALEEDLKIASEISTLDLKLRNNRSAQAANTALQEALQPWKSLDSDIGCPATKSCASALFAVPLACTLVDMDSALSEKVEEAQIYEISSDATNRYCEVIAIRERLDEAMEALQAFGAAQVEFKELSGTAGDNVLRLKSELDVLKAEEGTLLTAILAMAENRGEIKLGVERITQMITREEATSVLRCCSSVAVVEGFVTAPECEQLEKVLSEYDCAWELQDPQEEEYPSVPVKLKNNRFTDALNMVTNMYSLPQYGTVDPNPLMAPFFILFYGLMMADMGYGLLMVIAALVAMKKIKPKAGTLSFCRLLLYGGISTFVMGIITGGFFGDAPLQVAKIINPETTWTGIPALLDPLNDSVLVLVGSLVLGVIHLNAGLAVSFAQKIKAGDVKGALMYEGALWLILIGIGCTVLKVLVIESLGISAVLVAGIVVLFAGAVWGKKGFSIVTGLFSTLYNELTGWFGDILSYSRIMALMLAGAVIGQVFNTIGAMAGSLWLFIPVFLVGHALNFGLNLLGCYVHDLRLQCLEFFGKFYTDGGKAFNPLKIKTKYIEVNQ